MAALDFDLYRYFLRPLLFRLPAERAQKIAEFALKRQIPWHLLGSSSDVSDSRLSTHLCGVPLSSPIGLAAGFDKNCEMLPGLASLGFDYLTCGTLTKFSREGNKKPRLIRLNREMNLINALGFPNKGVDWGVSRLEVFRKSGNNKPIIVSVSGTSIDEIVHCHEKVEKLADVVEINISSPNTAGLRVFHKPAALEQLIGQINKNRKKPLMVKLPPQPVLKPVGERYLGDTVSLVKICLKTGVEGLTLSNSRPVKDIRLATGSGGLSGKTIFEDMLQMVEGVRAEIGNRLDINACGGIFTGQDAWRALKAGATTVQFYTAMVYLGPSVVKRMKCELLAILDVDGDISINSTRNL